MPDAYICRRLRRAKITRKASDVAEYIELFGSFTRGRRVDNDVHDNAYIGGRSENNINCVVHDDLG